MERKSSFIEKIFYIFPIPLLFLILKKNKSIFELSQKIIKSNSVDKILKKGFTIVEQNKKIIKRKNHLDPGLEFQIRFADGRLKIEK